MKIFLVGEAANHRDRLLACLDSGLGRRAEVVALPREAAASPDFDHRIGEQDVIVSLRLRRDGASLPPVRLLHVPGAGLDGIDFEALSPRTTVCNVFEHEGPIAEFVLASVLNWEIGLDALRRSFAPETWSDTYRNRVPHGELAGKTVGIVGFGRIGRAVAGRLRCCGVRLLAADPGLDRAAAAEADVTATDLARVLAESDYVVVACPLKAATRGMIGRAELARMKPTAVVVNVSRAEIIEEAALYEALRAHAIGGASLDVWYRYPTGAADAVQPSDHPFHELGNAICTPHSSAWTRELMERRYAVIAANVNALAAGRPLENVVRAGRP